MKKDPDFQKIVQSLMEIGLKQTKIADLIGCKQPTISHIYHDVWGTKQPSHRLAEPLLELAAKYGVRRNGSKDSKRWPRGSWTPLPPPPTANKVVLEREAA